MRQIKIFWRKHVKFCGFFVSTQVAKKGVVCNYGFLDQIVEVPSSETKFRVVATTDSLLQARSQKFVMGGTVWWVWGRSPQPPEANGGLGAKPQGAGGWEFGGKAPSRRRHGGLGAEPPALENFAFFAKITSF